MATQQLHSGSIQQSKTVFHDGWATLFFMMGALHIYGAMRKGKMKMNVSVSRSKLALLSVLIGTILLLYQF